MTVMESHGKLTKAQLLDEISGLIDQVENLSAQRDDAKAKIPAAPRPVPEALAIAAAVRALDTLVDEGRARPAIVSFNAAHEPVLASATPVGRVLRYLAERYGVPLVEEHLRDCDRRHVDELDTFAIQRALGGGLS